ncbi:MAG: helix-turn-helix transcriptional regulator [Planctomycetes bacterium]|nr:helix-turn-helix transcriptional regulator [Planctomycetota bacterium]
MTAKLAPAALRAITGGPRRHRALWTTARYVDLQSRVVSCGFDPQPGPEYDWRGSERGPSHWTLFQYTIAGEGLLSYDGVTRRVTAGSAMLLHFPHDNRYWLPRGGSWSFFYLCLSGRQVINAWRTVVARAGPLITLPRGSRVLASAADACAELLGGNEHSPYRVSACAYDLTMALLEHTETVPSEGAADAGLERAVAFAKDHLSEEIGVEDLARTSGFSRYHFTRRFQRAYGLAPGEYLVDLRIRTAATLLRESQPNIKDVATRCGFRDPAYFCKVFRRVMGTSPGEFRDSGMYGS